MFPGLIALIWTGCLTGLAWTRNPNQREVDPVDSIVQHCGSINIILQPFDFFAFGRQAPGARGLRSVTTSRPEQYLCACSLHRESSSSSSNVNSQVALAGRDLERETNNPDSKRAKVAILGC